MKYILVHQQTTTHLDNRKTIKTEQFCPKWKRWVQSRKNRMRLLVTQENIWLKKENKNTNTRK